MVKMTIGDALSEGIALLNGCRTESAGEDARVLLCSILKCDKLYLTVHRADGLSAKEAHAFFELIKRRSSGEPVSYITNTREFMSIDFYVDKNVLIPRPDTEILVEKTIELYRGKAPRIADMCTGSGAVAVSLAKYIEGAYVTGFDISPEAIEIARLNAERSGVSQRCFFRLADALGRYDFRADAIVSNPPYIPSEDIASLSGDVRDFEPRIALDGGEDGLDFYRAIVKNAPPCLTEGGLLAFEVGCGLSQAVSELMKADFSDIGVCRDLAGIDRVVYGFLNKR